MITYILLLCYRYTHGKMSPSTTPGRAAGSPLGGKSMMWLVSSWAIIVAVVVAVVLYVSVILSHVSLRVLDSVQVFKGVGSWTCIYFSTYCPSSTYVFYWNYSVSRDFTVTITPTTTTTTAIITTTKHNHTCNTLTKQAGWTTTPVAVRSCC